MPPQQRLNTAFCAKADAKVSIPREYTKFFKRKITKNTIFSRFITIQYTKNNDTHYLIIYIDH